ncbi:hypothetical protein FSB78_10445 [Sphingomonas ginsenosidivorax]|uniref:Uncharacterized protein n=1 Tax=Sphingomonas ginsenosidivorax TaxID=862135 RepID=A0A5C6UGY0_9SPHN|nr:hypothetical protein [Sphingomonas ginsenosidivorax]TXC71315.1 hypothetical protein FSB78_10445 [Sphingomonas ginsenosidivorax]
MEDTKFQHAFEVLSVLLKWEMKDRPLDWDHSVETLSHSGEGCVIWRANPAVGGSVRIVRDSRFLECAGGYELADIAKDLCDTGEQIVDHSFERAEGEREMTATAKTLLRRKVARGIRLARVECAPIPVDYYYNIGTEVTFEYELGGDSQQYMITADCVEDLKDRFERMIIELHSQSFRIAA